MAAFSHRPVLLDECVEALNVKPGGVYVDGTLGGGGHSEAICRRLRGGRLIGIDRDETALAAASERLSGFECFTPVRGNFRDVAAILAGLGINKIDGMLLDLGVSSPQLDEASRGFSYMADAPLDMRMDASSGATAADLIAGADEEELARIFFEYGEERYSRRIAAAIVRKRAEAPIETTGELVEIIKGAMPAAALREKQHPAKRVFQALRIAVNDELGALEELLDTAPDLLAPGGRLVIISFHSLEDRLVKNAIRKRERGCTCPPDLPVCVCGFVQTLRSVGRQPVTAGEAELKINPRARSAKLRVAERI
ncbi:MAG: 16S rRNA (cytosine(1402)-N(4))-methyltransferase RsmH [Oscillospiraceae bacterium]|nr:16S rRNA (cytosine(1402)-N(4))-methyltransferase RsmH [Oscillospiraceae bacterium]